MEQNVELGLPVAPVTPVAENAKKTNNVLKITTAVACVMAIFGIGFGIYGMVQSSQKADLIADLEYRIIEKDEIIESMSYGEENEEEEKKEEEVAQESTAETVLYPDSEETYYEKIEKLHEDVSLYSDRYMEITELGVKIKLPNISNDITYKEYVSELGDVFYDLYSDGVPTNLSVTFLPDTNIAAPDTTICYEAFDEKHVYVIGYKDDTAPLQPPLSTLIYFFKNTDKVFMKL